MPRRRPQHLHRETTRHGKVVWYVRLDKGKRVRIHETYGTTAFAKAVRDAISGTPSAAPRKVSSGSIAWAANLYRQSLTWSQLSPATRRQRSNILDRIEKSEAGLERLSAINRKSVEEGVAARSDRPAAARHFLATMRGFMTWAVAEDLIERDPTSGIVAKTNSTTGFPVWTDEDIAAFEARWPVGTRERVAFDVLLYTGLRRGDACILGRQHVKAGVIRLTTQKTGEKVTIVMCPELVTTLAAGPCGDLSYIAGERGRPRVKEAFGEWFRGACQAAGVRKSAHGLRKAAATRAANNGATERELEAMFGWTGGRMASLYTRSVDRERLSIAAAEKLGKRRT